VTISDAEAGSAQCSAAELRELFLFEKLTDDQLAWLCRVGQVRVVEPGPLYAEGEPATHFYVLLAGTVVLYRRVGVEDVEVTRSSSPGVYSGAFMAYVGDRVPQVYNNSMRVTERSRFFVLEAARFAELMTGWFPLAVHLLEGLFFGTRNAQEAVGQRERQLALGSLTAGLTHELNNPAAAAVRAAAALRERIAGMRGKLAAIAAGRIDGQVLASLIGLQEQVIERASKAPELSPVQVADREDAVSDWLDEHGVADAWELAPVFVQAGLDIGELDGVADALAGTAQDGAAQAGKAHGVLAGAIRWLGYAVETELLINEISDSVGRISSLVGAARQYSQLDRAPFGVADVRELLDSTLVMLAPKIGSGITVVKEYDRSLPQIPCYPAELNQVWTNLIDNAVFAMGDAGILTIRTAADDDKLLVEIADTGPGIPDEIKGRIFDQFFTTKPPGLGTGLGLEISWRIVVNRHHGDIRVESVPGDTRFQVRLPLTGAGE
jgi:signal transduction histidine kinase